MERPKLNLLLLIVIFSLIVFFLVIQTVNVKLNYTLQAEQEKLTKLVEDNKILFFKIEEANDLKEISRKAEEDCPEFIQYEKDYKEWSDKCKGIGKEKLSVTIPAGSILKVDRIYIRKGAKDFSSITFYVRGLGEITRTENWTNRKTTRKSLRFWAKLADCNTIEFI